MVTFLAHFNCMANGTELSPPDAYCSSKRGKEVTDAFIMTNVEAGSPLPSGPQLIVYSDKTINCSARDSFNTSALTVKTSLQRGSTWEWGLNVAGNQKVKASIEILVAELGIDIRAHGTHGKSSSTLEEVTFAIPSQSVSPCTETKITYKAKQEKTSNRITYTLYCHYNVLVKGEDGNFIKKPGGLTEKNLGTVTQTILAVASENLAESSSVSAPSCTDEEICNCQKAGLLPSSIP